MVYSVSKRGHGPGNQKKTQPVYYQKTCKLETCQKDFSTKRKSQEFCSAKHRQQHFMAQKYKLEYERGRNDMARRIWFMLLAEAKDVIHTSEIAWASGLQRACTMIERDNPDVVFHVEHSKAKAASA